MSETKFKDLFEKYKDTIPYLIFGVLTTVVNIVVYWFLAHPLKASIMLSTIVAWLASVLFAYLTNRKWVFHSDAETFNDYVREIVAFFAARLGTGVIDWGMMLVFAQWLGMNDVIIKIIANVIVIVLNYIASKFWIFKKRD